MYLRESPIRKDEVVVLVSVESIHTLFYGLTRGLYNLYETASLLNLSSTYAVKSFGLLVIGSLLVYMEAKSNLNVEYIEIYPTILKNSSNMPELAWISNYGRQFS